MLNNEILPIWIFLLGPIVEYPRFQRTPQFLKQDARPFFLEFTNRIWKISYHLNAAPLNPTSLISHLKKFPLPILYSYNWILKCNLEKYSLEHLKIMESGRNNLNLFLPPLLNIENILFTFKNNYLSLDYSSLETHLYSLNKPY